MSFDAPWKYLRAAAQRLVAKIWGLISLEDVGNGQAPVVYLDIHTIGCQI